MKCVVAVRVESIERTEISGILSVSLIGVEDSFSSRLELPEQLIAGKVGEDDVVRMIISDSSISSKDLEEYGSPIIILNGTVFKRSMENGMVKYWISFHGLQFRLISKDDFLGNARNIWVGLVK